MMQLLNKDNFNSFIEDSELSLVAFLSDNCPPCKLMFPALSVLSKDFKGKCKVGIYAVDRLDEEPIIKNNIKGTPEILLFHKGIKLETLGGRQTYQTLSDLINKVLEE